MQQALPTPSFGNYLETGNPFGLSRPPAFFLQAMRTQDAHLALFPSMEDCVYRLCRRVTVGPPPAVAMALRPDKHPDTAFMGSHRLMGITAIVPFPRWGPMLLDDITQMDMWRCKGGSDGFCNALEKLEEEKAARQDALLIDEAGQRSNSAFEAMKLRQGSTVFLTNP